VSGTLRELAILFLRLGTTAFGGPAAQVALMREQVVRKRGWLSDQQFLDLLGAANLIPGSNSTEMAIHIGRLRAGWRGLVVAGACFILPAFFMVLAIAWAYVEYGSMPQVQSVLYGVKPVVVVIVALALGGWGRTAVKSRWMAVILGVALLLAWWRANELAVIFGAGIISAALSRGAAWRTMHSVALWPVFLFFAKVGSVLFGSGYVLIAYLRGDLVERLHWLTQSQLLDAIAAGQVTPGPEFAAATFIGYLLAGTPGAIAATGGIFLPAFLFVGLSGPVVDRWRNSRTAGAFLDGVNAASLGVMAVVMVDLGRAAVTDGLTILLAGLSAIALWRRVASPTVLLLAGAAIGALSSLWAS
jgi:chromate transporter